MAVLPGYFLSGKMPPAPLPLSFYLEVKKKQRCRRHGSRLNILLNKKFLSTYLKIIKSMNLLRYERYVYKKITVLVF